MTKHKIQNKFKYQILKSSAEGACPPQAEKYRFYYLDFNI